MTSLSCIEPSMPNASLAGNNGGSLTMKMNEHKTLQSSLAATPEEALDFSLKKMSETASVAASVMQSSNFEKKSKNSEKTEFNGLLITNDNSQSKYLNGIHSPIGTSSSSFVSDLTPFISDDCASSINSNSTK